MTTNRKPQDHLVTEKLEERQLLSSVDVFAAGVTNQETIQLKIDDAVVQTWTNVGGDAYGNEFVQLSYTTAASIAPGQIKVEFTNDQNTAGADRNVRIDRIVVDGTTIQTESPQVFSTGTWKPEDGVVAGFRESEFLHANGYFQYAEQTSSQINVRVRGDEGTEQFNLIVDGETVSTFTANTSSRTVSYTYDGIVDPENVRIELINSQYIPVQGIDSNLYVDFMSINGERFETEDSSVFSTGTWTAADGIVPGFGRGDVLHGDGFIQFGSQSGNSGSEILVRARGAEGTERFNLTVDGEVVGTFNVTADGQYATFGYRHDASVAAEDIRIDFINDEWNPSQGIDSNLIVDFISVNGKAYQTESPAVFSTGTWAAADGVTPGYRESETLHVNGYFQFANSSYVSYLDAEGDGEWSDVEPLGLIPIHAMVLPDGKVLSFGTDERGMQSGEFIYSLYDPETGIEVILPNTTDTDVFCSNMSIDPMTGNVLITGGDARGEGGPVNGPINDVVVFDYENLTIRDSTQGEMEYARWYGSSVTLPSGEIFVLGGTGGGENIPEVFNAETGWRTLTGVDININYYYPKTWVTSDGSVIVFSTQRDIYRINTDGVGSSQKVGRLTAVNGGGNPNIMYDVDKVAFVGSDSKIYTADLSDANPTFTAVATVSSARRDGGMIALPDGRVALVGGSRQFNVLDTAVTVTEIWDPATNDIEVVESLGVARLYHSTHILLPNGTIWSGGGGAPGPIQNLNVEFYAPDYLYGSDGTLADRPVITDAPSNVGNSSTFNIDVDDTSDISRVTAVRTGALTHGINNDSRFVELDFTVSGNTIQVTTLDENIMVPGTWMLYVLDSDGVPSGAAMLGVSMVNVVDTPHFR